MGCGISLGVITLVLPSQMQAFDLQGFDLTRELGIDLTLEVNKGLLLLSNPLLNIAKAHPEQLCQLRKLLIAGTKLWRIHPHRAGGQTGGERVAVSIEDLPARSRQLQRPLVAHLTLALQEVLRNHLQPDRPRNQRKKSQREEKKGDA